MSQDSRLPIIIGKGGGSQLEGKTRAERDGQLVKRRLDEEFTDFFSCLLNIVYSLAKCRFESESVKTRVN